VSAGRVHTAEYQGARNRVAVVVGESALMASIRHIPEETILILDKSSAMIGYMTDYIQALRASGSMEDWYARMGFSGPDRQYPILIGQRLRQVIAWQARYWTLGGYDHPSVSDEAFDEARDLANQKAIIPWHADITSKKDMSRLGKLLKAYEASVTLLNLTNVLVCEDGIRTAEQAAGHLDALPFTSNVPIILTSEADPGKNPAFAFTHAARLFFGLDDLRQNGGITDMDSPLRGPAINPVIQA